MQINTNWYFDIEELYAAGTVEFSVGPFTFGQGETITLLELTDVVNTALLQNFAIRLPEFNNNTSGTPLYGLEMEPEFNWRPLADGGGFYQGTQPFVVNQILQHEAFPIRTIFYQINNPNNIVHPSFGQWQGFRIEFKTGEHGWFVDQPPADVPYGEVEIENQTDTRAIVLHQSAASKVVAMNDNPPVPPNFRIVPFNGVSDRLLLLLNSNTGEFPAVPIPIKPGEIETLYSQHVTQNGAGMSLEEFRQSVDNRSPETALIYKNDDPIKEYEVFRTTVKPTSYSDFNTIDNPHEVMSGKVTINKESTAASLIDIVEPNTKYYYCARAVDVHRNFSNPTHVFEAELVDNEGQVYLILNTIYFEPEGMPDEKVGRRFVYIEPSLRNLQFNPNIQVGQQDQPPTPLELATIQSLPGNNLLGVTEGDGGPADCWDKTFKVRVTSKKTGKKVDLNITFKNSGVVNP